MKEEEFDKIEPIIENKEVVSLKINNRDIPLKKPMPISYFSTKFLDSFSVIEEYFDISSIYENEPQISSWNKSELKDFLLTLTETQYQILNILTEVKQVSREELIGKINALNLEDPIDNKKLAGIVAGLNRRINRIKHEKFFVIISDTYKINEEYSMILEELLTK